MIMEWKDIAGTVTKAAPMLGTLLGGPVGGAIGGVISLIGSALGLSPAETTPDKVSQMLSVDPQAAVKLAEIESTHKIRIQELLLEQDRLVIDGMKAEFQDTASARQRQVDITKATGKQDINIYILAWVVVLGFFGLTSLLIFHSVPKDQNDVVFMLFGGLVSGFSTVLGYFFGSSRGSLMKSQLLASTAVAK
jgi:hypothetical protein